MPLSQKIWIFCWVTECNIHLLSCCPTVRWMFGRLFGFWEANTAILWELTGWPLEFHFITSMCAPKWNEWKQLSNCNASERSSQLYCSIFDKCYQTEKRINEFLSDSIIYILPMCHHLAFLSSSPVVAAVVPHIWFQFSNNFFHSGPKCPRTYSSKNWYITKKPNYTYTAQHDVINHVHYCLVLVCISIFS